MLYKTLAGGVELQRVKENAKIVNDRLPRNAKKTQMCEGMNDEQSKRRNAEDNGNVTKTKWKSTTDNKRYYTVFRLELNFRAIISLVSWNLERGDLGLEWESLNM